MKKLFWFGLTGLILFELANVYFIMPMPGSQQMNSIDLAYFLYSYRWYFRIGLAIAAAVGSILSVWKRKWAVVIPIITLAVVIYLVNYKMAADAMFQQPQNIIFKTVADNKVDSNRLVIGIELNGKAKAYPIQFIGYHHHLQDTLDGKAILVTYCTVCRTGRVFQPIVNGQQEQFRLVGMDHFNAMLEDATTKSWWRQSTGEAITGKRKGTKLTELMSTQTSLEKWIQLHPNTTILQADPAFANRYDSSFKYEQGKSKSKLTGTDSLSWRDKSWVIGIKAGDASKAYDWNMLKQKRIVKDTLNQTAIIVLLANDNRSFFAFELPANTNSVSLLNDTLLLNTKHYRINGKGIDTGFNLKPVYAYQEFWHSWKTFQPQTDH